MDHPRYHEPWTYGEEAQRIFVKYDSLRYTLIPYIYSNAFRMYRTSRPLMTPLLYDFTSDELTYNISDQYLFGEWMMVCPVTSKGALSRPVYFPGERWVDFWTGERIEGRQYKSFLTPPDLMPIFIREGAIIPKQPSMQYMEERPVDTVTLTVFPARHSEYEMYEDDGRTDQYRQGIYAITRIVCQQDGQICTLTIHRPEGRFTPARHAYHAEVYWDEEPSQVLQNQKPMARIQPDADAEGWYFDTQLRRVIIKSRLTNQKNIEFKIMPQ